MSASPIYKYLHIDSGDRNEHETSARMDIHLAANPITNIKRVGVLKASITNTGHNVFFNHDSVEIGIKINGANGADDPTAHAVRFSLPHKYYTIATLISELNAQIQLYDNVANPNLETAVKNITFSLEVDPDTNTERVKMTATAHSEPGINVFYALIVRTRHTPNSILPDLGFHGEQTVSEIIWKRMASNIGSGGTLYIKDTPSSPKKVIQGSNGSSSPNYITANNTYRIENMKGYYFGSKALTAGGNVMKTSLNANGVGIVQHDDHLVYIPNKANRDEYNHYETNIVEWHEVNGDIQNFDLELRSDGDKLLKVEDSSLDEAGQGSAIPPFSVTLIFECSRTSFIHPDNSRAAQNESYFLAHSQN